VPAEGAPGRAAGTVIRPSAEADLAAIREVYAHHVLHGVASFEEVPPDAAEMARRRAAAPPQSLSARYRSRSREGLPSSNWKDSISKRFRPTISASSG
jgi:phosphinothricin acetyltransferase